MIDIFEEEVKNPLKELLKNFRVGKTYLEWFFSSNIILSDLKSFGLEKRKFYKQKSCFRIKIASFNYLWKSEKNDLKSKEANI